jgi:starch synthase
VHHVGGLKDTIENGVTGFGFTGDTVEAQVDAFVETSMDAIRTKLRHAAEWKRICANAAAMRFLWSDAVDKYIELLYQPEKLP